MTGHMRSNSSPHLPTRVNPQRIDESSATTNFSAYDPSSYPIPDDSTPLEGAPALARNDQSESTFQESQTVVKSRSSVSSSAQEGRSASVPYDVADLLVAGTMSDNIRQSTLDQESREQDAAQRHEWLLQHGTGYLQQASLQHRDPTTGTKNSRATGTAVPVAAVPPNLSKNTSGSWSNPPANEQLVTDDMVTPGPTVFPSQPFRRIVPVLNRRRRNPHSGQMSGNFNNSGTRFLDVDSTQPPLVGVRRLFQMRQHAQTIISRSLSQVSDVSQRGAMTEILSESAEVCEVPNADQRMEKNEDKTSRDPNVVVRPPPDHVSHLPSQEVKNLTCDESEPVHVRHRKNELKFLEFDEIGHYRERCLARQELLVEIRGASSGKPYFKRSGNSHFVRSAMDYDGPLAHSRDQHSMKKRGQKVKPDTNAARASAKMSESKFDKIQHGSGRIALTLRDIRQVDPAFTAKAALWVRQNCVLVSLEYVRAIILHDKLLLFDPENEKVKQPIAYIQQRLAFGQRNADEAFMPFEFRALEGILIHACISVERDFHRIEQSLVNGLLKTLPSHSNQEYLERLRREEQSLNHFDARVRKLQHVLQTVLETDEDMANMYLTEKHKNPNIRRNPVDHDEVEMLVESYLQVVDDLTSKAELLNQAIDDTENLIEIHLNTNQNELLRITVRISVISMLIGFATKIFGIFGMNLPLPYIMKNLPDSQYFFYATVIVTVLVVGVAGVLVTEWCRKLGQGLYSKRHWTFWHY